MCVVGVLFVAEIVGGDGGGIGFDLDLNRARHYSFSLTLSNWL